VEGMKITLKASMTHKAVILTEVKMACLVGLVLTLKASQGGVRRKTTKEGISNATNEIKHTYPIQLSILIPN
jgi:hypothetical protein